MIAPVAVRLTVPDGAATCFYYVVLQLPPGEYEIGLVVYPLLVFDPLSLAVCTRGFGSVTQGFQEVVDLDIQVRDCSQIIH